MSEALIDTLVASGLTRAQAHAVFRLDADVHCRRVFDRAIACRDLVGSGFSPEDAENGHRPSPRGAAARGRRLRCRGAGDEGVVTDTLRVHDRLVAGGLSAEQARTFLRLLADAEAGRFDRRNAHGQLLDASFGPAQAAVLLGDLLQRLAARRAGDGPR